MNISESYKKLQNLLRRECNFNLKNTDLYSERIFGKNGIYSSKDRELVCEDEIWSHNKYVRALKDIEYIKNKYPNKDIKCELKEYRDINGSYEKYVNRQILLYFHI